MINMELVVGILSLLLGYYIFRRSGAQISVKTCLVKMKTPKSGLGKSGQVVKWVNITFINRSSHPVRIEKIITFHYQNRVKKFLHKSDKGPINITCHDLFPLILEASQPYHSCLTSTDFCGDIPTNGFLLYEIYFTHSDKPIRKTLDLSREKIEWNIKPLKEGET